MGVDDQRAAVGFSVTLSGQLIASSMAMLAVEAAYVWYALGGRSTRAGFEFFAALAALAIAASIFIAGKGITKARNAGFAGTWDLAAGKDQFNLQATLLVVAILLLVVMFSLSGPVKESTLDRKLDDLRTQVEVLRQTQPKQGELLERVRKLEEEQKRMVDDIQLLRSQRNPESRTNPHKDP